MEDVLTTYALPYDADYPQVCLDEKLVTLHADVVSRYRSNPVNRNGSIMSMSVRARPTCLSWSNDWLVTVMLKSRRG